jgi:hypothetical protein
MEIFLAQPACHGQCMRVAESNVLSERKNLSVWNLRANSEESKG